MFILLIYLTIFRFVYSISRNPILIVVSYDGFRYDYLNQHLTPNMLKLRQEGTFAEYIYNVFPTKTFPNHFTIATGVYTEVHGVVGNSFYDSHLKVIIKIGEQMFTQNKQILPIWTLNELSGTDRYSGVMMWPGGEYSYQNKKPTYIETWSHNYDIFKRVDKIMEWLTDHKKPANLIMLYIEEPDYYSHIYGPDSSVVYERIKVLDNVTQYLDNQLQRYKLKDVATVIHLSDHGMSEVKYSNIVNITQYLQQDTYTLLDTSPCLHVIPKDGHENSIFDNLRKASEELQTFDVYKKEDLPERWHFKHNDRTPPIFLLAKEGYGFQDLIELAEYYKDTAQIKVTPDRVFGVHGYDTEYSKMHPFFMIRGPQIKRNHKVSPFNFVDLYNLFTDVLKIKSVPNNGSFLIQKDIFTSGINSVTSVILITVGGVILSLLLISCAAAITILLIKRQQNMTTTAALNKRFPQTFQQSIEAQHLLDTEEA